MYSNIGKKLCVLAKICGWIGIACVVVGAAIELTGSGRYNGTIFLSSCALGLTCFISSWPLYAFGQLVDDVHKMAEGTAQPNNADELPEL